MTDANLLETGGELGIVESHPNYVAGFKAGHAAGMKRAASNGADYRDGVNVDALAHALLLMGIAGCGQEEMAARMSHYVNSLTRGVDAYFARWNAEHPNHDPAIPPLDHPTHQG
jgi:hypothetical protein